MFRVVLRLWMVIGLVLGAPATVLYASSSGGTRVVGANEVVEQDFARAKMLFQIGEIGAAVAALEMLIDAHPQSDATFDATLFLGEIYLGQKQPAKAKKVAEKYIATHPDESRIDRVRELLTRADKFNGKPIDKSATTPSIVPSPTISKPEEFMMPAPPAMPLVMVATSAPAAPSTIGLILPLSGQYAVYGERALIAVQMALGLPFIKPGGQPIIMQQSDQLTLVVGDSKGDVNTASSLVEILVNQYFAIVLLGDILVDTSQAVAKKAQEIGVPNLSLSRRAGLVEIGPNVFRLGLTTQKQTRALVERAMGPLAIKKFAIMFPTHAYGVEMKDSFVDEVKQRGGEVTLMIPYKPDETTFTSHVNQLGQRQFGAYPVYAECVKKAEGKSAKEIDKCKSLVPPKVDFGALFIPDFAKTVSYIVPAMAAQDFLVSQNEQRVSAYRRRAQDAKPIQLLGPSSWQGSLLAERLGHQVDGALFVDGINWADNGEVAHFMIGYKELVKADPSIVEAQAYDAARILRSIMRPIATERVPQTRDEFRAKLLSVQNFRGVTGAISFEKTRDSVAPLHWFGFKDAKLRDLP